MGVCASIPVTEPPRRRRKNASPQSGGGADSGSQSEYSFPRGFFTRLSSQNAKKGGRGRSSSFGQVSESDIAMSEIGGSVADEAQSPPFSPSVSSPTSPTPPTPHSRSVSVSMQGHQPSVSSILRVSKIDSAWAHTNGTSESAGPAVVDPSEFEEKDLEIVSAKPNGRRSKAVAPSPPVTSLPLPLTTSTRRRRRRKADPELIESEVVNDTEDNLPFDDDDAISQPPIASPMGAQNPFDRLLSQSRSTPPATVRSTTIIPVDALPARAPAVVTFAAPTVKPTTPVAATAAAAPAPFASSSTSTTASVPTVRRPHTPPNVQRTKTPRRFAPTTSSSLPTSPQLNHATATPHALPHSLSTSALPSSTLQSFVSRMESSLLPGAASQSTSTGLTLLAQPSTPPPQSSHSVQSALTPQAKELNFPLSSAMFLNSTNSGFQLTDLESFEHDRINFLKRGGHFIAHVINRRHHSMTGVIKRQYSLSCSLSCPDLSKIVMSSENGSLSFYFTEPSHTALSPPGMKRGSHASTAHTHNGSVNATTYYTAGPLPTHAVIHPTGDLIDACIGLFDVTAEQLAKHRKHTPLFDPSCCLTVFFAYSAPLYLQARSVDERNIWLNALLWLKDLTNEDLRESLFLFQRDTLAVDNERRRKDTDETTNVSSVSSKQSSMKLGGRSGKYATIGSQTQRDRKGSTGSGRTLGRERSHRSSSVSSASLTVMDPAMKSVEIHRDTTKGEQQIRASGGSGSGGKGKSNLTIRTGRTSTQDLDYDFLTGPNIDGASWKQDRFTDVLTHGQIFTYYHNRTETGELIFLSCDNSLTNIRYGRLTESLCVNELHTSFPPSLPIKFSQAFIDNFPYDHSIPSSTISDVVTGEASLLFGIVKWPFSLHFHTYKNIVGKSKHMAFAVFSSSERLTWVKALKWLKDHTSNVGIPYNVHRVAYLDTDLQWKSNSDKELLDQFSIQPQNLLGKGGFASVYLATHTPTKTQFAIKIFNNFNVTIQNEISVLKEIRHENVVSYYGCFPTKDEKMYVIMELCEAGSLHDLLTKKLKEKLKEFHIAYILKCTLAALNYLHSKNIIHRDIKSANILLKKNGAVKLVDFGIAAKRKPLTLGAVPAPSSSVAVMLLSSSASPSNPYLTQSVPSTNDTATNDVIGGTPLWMPIEAIKGEKVDFKADSWSLGITAIEIAEGKPPYHDLPNFHSVAYEICYSEPPSLATHAPSYKNPSQEFDDFVKCCLLKDRKERWSIQQLLQHPFIIKYFPAASVTPVSQSGSSSMSPPLSVVASTPASPSPAVAGARRARSFEVASAMLSSPAAAASKLASLPALLISPSTSSHPSSTAMPPMMSPTGSPGHSNMSPMSPVTEVDDSFRVLLKYGQYNPPPPPPPPAQGSPSISHTTFDLAHRSPSTPVVALRPVPAITPSVHEEYKERERGQAVRPFGNAAVALPAPVNDVKKRQRQRRDGSIILEPVKLDGQRGGEIFPDLVPVESLVLTAGSTLADAAAAFASFVKQREEALGPALSTAGRAHRRKKSMSLKHTQTLPIQEEEEEEEMESNHDQLYGETASPVRPSDPRLTVDINTNTLSLSSSSADNDSQVRLNDCKNSSSPSPPLALSPDSSHSVNGGDGSEIPIIQARPPFGLRLNVGDDTNDDDHNALITQRHSHSSPSPTSQSCNTSALKFKPSLRLGGEEDEADEEEGEIQTFSVAASPSHMMRAQRDADARRKGGKFSIAVDDDDRPLEESYVIHQDGAFVAKGIKVTAQGIQSTQANVSRLETIADSPNGDKRSSPDSQQSRFDHQSTNTLSMSHASSNANIPSIALNKDDLVRLGVIGKGQNGQVYKAIHLPTLTRVALKSMNIYEKGTRHQLLHELSAYAALQSPYLVAFLGAYHEAGVITVASEYMDCGSLQSFVKHFGAITDETLMKLIAKQSALGLHYLHTNHRVHRDIKPDNILLNVKGQCRLADFGLLTELESTQAFTDTFLGTLAYLSPERLQSSSYSYKSDIWSLGLSFLFMVQGSLPLQCTDYWQMLDMLSKSPPRLERGTGFSDDLCDFIDQCLQINEEDRASAAQLLQHPFLVDVMDDDYDSDHVRGRQCIENATHRRRHPSANNSVSSDGEGSFDDYTIGNNRVDLEIILDLIIEKHLLHCSEKELQSHAALLTKSFHSSVHSMLLLPPASQRLLRGSTTLDTKRLSVLADQFGLSKEEVQGMFMQRQELFQQSRQQPA